MYYQTKEEKEEKEKKEFVWLLGAVALVTELLFPLSIVGFIIMVVVLLLLKVMNFTIKERCVLIGVCTIGSILYFSIGLQLGFSQYFENYHMALSDVYILSGPVTALQSIWEQLFLGNFKAISLNISIGLFLGCIVNIYKISKNMSY